MATVLAALFYAAATIAVAIITGITAVVLLRMILRGPDAAAEAASRGESLKAWWSALHHPMSATGARLDQRLALAGRKDKRFGTVMVEERASQPHFGR